MRIASFNEGRVGVIDGTDVVDVTTLVAASDSAGISAMRLLITRWDELGEEIDAVSPVHDEKIRVQVCHPIFIDPQGELVRA